MNTKHRSKRLVGSFTLMLITAAVLAAVFASSSSSSTGAHAAKNPNSLTVAMIVDQSRGDDATVDGMISGMANGAKAFGYTKTKFVSVLDPTQYEATLRALAQAGYPLIIGAVQGLGPTFDAVAPSFPHTKFVIFFAPPPKHSPNIISYTDQQQYLGYPAGIAAGLVTKTNKLGYVLGIEYPLIRDAEAGFIAGALSVNPKIKVYDAVPNTLTDPAVGREVATSLFNKGIDVIASLSVHTSLGIYQYADQLRKQGQKVWVASNDVQHLSNYAGDAALVSSPFILQTAVYAIMQEFKNGTLTGGVTHQMTLANRQIGIFQWGSQVPHKVIAEVVAAEAKVFHGYQVPDHTSIAKYVKEGILIRG